MLFLFFSFLFFRLKGNVIDSYMNLWNTGYGGINDHTLIVDREYADSLFRGLIEDYYFDIASHGEFWCNPETLLRRMAVYYEVKIVLISPCNFPFLPIFKRQNGTHWNFWGNLKNKEAYTTYQKKCSLAHEASSVPGKDALISYIDTSARPAWCWCCLSSSFGTSQLFQPRVLEKARKKYWRRCYSF